jgi:hypothetical protein
MKKMFRYLLVLCGMGPLLFSGGESAYAQNLPPLIDPIGTCYVNEGETLSIDLRATDPDDDILEIGAFNLPPQAVFTDAGTGEASFLWVPEFIGPHSSSGSPFELFFVVSDGSLDAQIKVKVNAINVNRPPELILPDSQTVAAGAELVFQVRAEDWDKEKVIITAVNLPNGASLDEEGIFSWIPELADTGEYSVSFEAVDLSGGSALREAHIRVIPPSPCVLSIGVEQGLVGGKVEIPINLKNPEPIAGMEILIQYDPTAYTFLGLTKEGTRVSEWERYVYREKTWGLFQLIKIVGIADFPNEVGVASLPEGDGPVAHLQFGMTSDTQLAGLLIPLEFCYFDLTDNTLSNSVGEFISRDEINFNNGGVLLESGNTLLGDINLNGIPFEVGDAVRLAVSFSVGMNLNQQQLLNSDVNRDGVWATLGDLIYLVARIQEEGVAPDVEPGPQTQVAEIAISQLSGGTSFSVSSDGRTGGLLFVFRETGLRDDNVEFSSEVQDMDLYTGSNGEELRVMIMSTEGRFISSGTESLFRLEGDGEFDSVEISVCDREGNLVAVRKVYQESSNLPAGFALSQNYPNPFNPVTRIQYEVGNNQQKAEDLTGHTSLKVYNLLGQLVRVLVDQRQAPGSYQVAWDGKDEDGHEVASGIYFYRLECDQYVETKKMVLLR